MKRLAHSSSALSALSSASEDRFSGGLYMDEDNPTTAATSPLSSMQFDSPGDKSRYAAQQEHLRPPTVHKNQQYPSSRAIGTLDDETESDYYPGEFFTVKGRQSFGINKSPKKILDKPEPSLDTDAEPPYWRSSQTLKKRPSKKKEFPVLVHSSPAKISSGISLSAPRRAHSDASDYSNKAWAEETTLASSAVASPKSFAGRNPYDTSFPQSAPNVSIVPTTPLRIKGKNNSQSPYQLQEPADMEPVTLQQQASRFPPIDVSLCQDHYATDVCVGPFFEDSLEDYDAMKLSEFINKTAMSSLLTDSEASDLEGHRGGRTRRRLGRLRRKKSSAQLHVDRFFADDEVPLDSNYKDWDNEIHTTLAMQTVLSKLATEHLGRYPDAATVTSFSAPSPSTPSRSGAYSAATTSLSPNSAAGVASALSPESSSGFASIYVLDFVKPAMEAAAKKANFNTTLYVSGDEEKMWLAHEYEYRKAALKGKVGKVMYGPSPEHDMDVAHGADTPSPTFSAKAARAAAKLASRKNIEDYYYDETLIGVQNTVDNGSDDGMDVLSDYEDGGRNGVSRGLRLRPLASRRSLATKEDSEATNTKGTSKGKDKTRRTFRSRRRDRKRDSNLSFESEASSSSAADSFLTAEGSGGNDGGGGSKLSLVNTNRGDNQQQYSRNIFKRWFRRNAT